MPNKATCPACGHRPVRFGQIITNGQIRTTFFCDNCEHSWSSMAYPAIHSDTSTRKPRHTGD